MTNFYDRGHRDLQDEFESRALADRLEAFVVKDETGEDEAGQDEGEADVFSPITHEDDEEDEVSEATSAPGSPSVLPTSPGGSVLRDHVNFPAGSPDSLKQQEEAMVTLVRKMSTPDET